MKETSFSKAMQLIWDGIQLGRIDWSKVRKADIRTLRTGSSTVEQLPHKGQEAGSTPARSTLGCGAGVAR